MRRDKQNRFYLTKDQAVEGLTVIVDGDFSCLKPWSSHQIKKDFNEGLYIACSHGKHYLEGQLEDDCYIGVYSLEFWIK